VTISFVVPVRNGADHLPRCLASIRAACLDVSCEVIVVDNGSTDGSSELAGQAGAQVIALSGGRVGAVRNAGARAARAEVLAFVDVDHEIDPGWVRACRNVLQDPTVGAAGSLCSAPQPSTWVQHLYDLLRSRSAKRVDVPWLGAGNLAVRRDIFLRLGGFDETLEACEDVALCERIVRDGWRIVSDPGMASVHHGDPRTLKALLLGEMWRGQDNLRVSLRGSWRARVGALVPLATLIVTAALPVTALAWPWLGPAPWVTAVGCLGLIALRRAIEMIARGRVWAPALWAQSFIVALTFEVARGLALVGAVTHATRVRVGST